MGRDGGGRGNSRFVLSKGIHTHVHDEGIGDAVLMMHGSAPGSTALSEWRLNLPSLAEQYRVVAPDMVGFGLTKRPDGLQGGLQQWVDHMIGTMDALGIDQAHLVGHSFGGGLALALALRRPERVRRLVMIGSLGSRFHITPELDEVWGYRPSLDTMRALTGKLRFDHRQMSEEALEERYRDSSSQADDYARMFPEPRQRWVSMMAGPEEDLRALKAHALIVHGRDDRVIPLSNAYRLLELMPNAELHVFTRCGNWTHLERADEVNQLIRAFLDRRDDDRG